MVCDRCKMVVKQQLEYLGFQVSEIGLGIATVVSQPDSNQLLEISSSLKLYGFELVDNEKDRIVQRIKDLIVEIVHHSDLMDGGINISEYLSQNLNKRYTYLSKLFSGVEGFTVEKFIIQQKIEKVKELLEYGELSLNEIAWKMGYSSSAHLATQFKNITGVTTSQFKLSEQGGRVPLDKIKS